MRFGFHFGEMLESHLEDAIQCYCFPLPDAGAIIIKDEVNAISIASSNRQCPFLERLPEEGQLL